MYEWGVGDVMEDALASFGNLVYGRGAGCRIGRWRLGALLEDGEHGPVYEAKEEGDPGRRGALQVLSRRVGASSTDLDVTFRVERRYFREQQIVARIGDPRIVQVLDADLAQPAAVGWIAYVVTDATGPTLASLLQRDGALGIDGAIDVVLPVARALASVHAAGCLHRSLSPRVVHVGDTVKLGGFGVFILLEPNEEDMFDDRVAAPLRTLAYHAPEMIIGARTVDASVDVYGLGLVLHECITGRLVFDEDSLHGMLQRKMFDSPPSLPGEGRRGAELDRLVKRMLARDPEGRPVVKEVIGRLERLRG
jgi:serine/threonine-protein kinase